MRVVELQTSRPDDARLGGSKHHQLQIDGNTNKTLNLSKIQLHFGVFDNFRLQTPTNPKIQLQRHVPFHQA
jgi:hypothetical protein